MNNVKNPIASFLIVFFMTLGLIAVSGCGGSDDSDQSTDNKHDEHTDGNHEDHEHAHPLHGGFIVEIGEELMHVELVHKGGEGKLLAYVTGKDGKTAHATSEAPVVNLKSKDGYKQFTLQAVSPKDGRAFQYEISAPELQDGPNGMEQLLEPLQGRLVIKLDGKTYNSDFKEEEHDHHYD